jgi:hypothetical protein
VVGDTTLKRVTLVSGKGALGTWRSPTGQRRVSEEPVFADEPAGKRDRRGVYASQRLSFLVFRKAFRGKPGSEPYSGNPTVRDRRGACGNVDACRARRSSIPTHGCVNGLDRRQYAQTSDGVPARRDSTGRPREWRAASGADDTRDGRDAWPAWGEGSGGLVGALA